MQQMWTQAWLSDEQEQPLGSAGFPSYGGSRMATQGSQMAFDGGIQNGWWWLQNGRKLLMNENNVHQLKFYYSIKLRPNILFNLKICDN